MTNSLRKNLVRNVAPVQSVIDQARSSSDLIRQPPPRFARNQFQVPQEILVPAGSNIRNNELKKIADWLYKNKHPVIPETTSAHSDKPISNIAIIIANYGTEPIRVKACTQAIKRLLKADPKPAMFIFVEALEENVESPFSFLKDYDNVKIIKKTIKEKNKNLFQKEVLWTIGTNYAFEQDGIDKCVLIDADCAFHDNSYLHYINLELNKYQFIQPYVGVNYSDQRDLKYGTSHILLSQAYGLTIDCNEYLAPGGSYACTKQFFYDILEGQWPYNALGSGDVALWFFIKGKTAKISRLPQGTNERTIYTDGQYPYFKVGYADLLLNHYYHGPMVNRMYTTRDYLSKKYNSNKSVIVDEEGLLAWNDSIEGKIFQECTNILKQKTNAYLSVGRRYTVYDTKIMAKQVSSRYFDSIKDNTPFIITTVYRKDYDPSPQVIIKMYNQLKQTILDPFEFVVFTDSTINGEFKQYPINLSRITSPGSWRRLSVFQKIFNQDTSVLFIDPSVTIKDQCNIVQCPKNHLYLARTNSGRWDSSIMYFRGIPSDIFKDYQELSKQNSSVRPEYLYLEPATYLTACLYSKTTTIKNISVLVDYCYKNSTTNTDSINFILS